MIRYKKLTEYNVYKSIYDSVYEDGKSEYNWDFVSEAIKRKEFRLYSILEDGEAIGTCGFSNILDGITIYELMVKKEHQGKGYGKKILNYTITQIKSLSKPPHLIMAFTNAKHFFELNDFSEIDYNEESIDKYEMMLLL